MALFSFLLSKQAMPPPADGTILVQQSDFKALNATVHLILKQQSEEFKQNKRARGHHANGDSTSEVRERARKRMKAQLGAAIP